MKRTWRIMPMGQLCSISSGESDTKDAVQDGPYAFFDRSKTIKRSRRFLYDCEALIIPGEGKEFLPRQFKGKFDLHQRAYALLGFDPQIDARFLYYVLHYRADYFPSVAVGATVKSLRRRHFVEFLVPVPTIPEQQRIIAILDEAFAGIATAKANAEKNLQNARGIFESQVQAVFSQRGEEWVEKKIGECFKVRSGEFLPAKKMVPTGPFDVYGGNGVNGKHDKRNLSGENIIIGRVGAKCGNVRCVDADLWVTDNAFYISTYLREFDLKFLALALERKQLRSTANQAAQPVISYTTIKDVVIEFPGTVACQKKIREALLNLEVETQKLASIYERKIAALDALKKSFLHRAFAGELTAGSAAKLVEAVA